MKPQNRIVVYFFLFGGIVVLWAGFHTSSPDLPSDFGWEHERHPSKLSTSSSLVRGQKTEGKPFPRPDIAKEEVKKSKELQKPVVPEAPPLPLNMKAKTTLEAADTVPEAQEQAQEEVFPPLPKHVTGTWNDDLHKVQSQLVLQLAGSPAEQREWQARYRQGGAPPPSPLDTVIRRQLLTRQCCNKFLGAQPWTREALLKDLKHFIRDVYPRRPIKVNTFGMRLSHAFGCWFIVKTLQPKYILESGVHRGQSTWLMRQAAPEAKIISMDPRTDMTYWDKGTTYYTGNGVGKSGYDVKPFKDFAEIDWSFIVDKNEALILWDDHQNEFKRILKAYELGFRHMIFDDNWSPLQGDNYSLKQVCDETGGLALRPPDFPSQQVLMCDQFHMADKFISIEEHKTNHEKLVGILDLYYETPPILFVPPHMQYTPFGHKPTADKSAVEYVMPHPSVRLLKWMCEAIIPPPLVQSQAEFDDVGAANVSHTDLWFYMSLGYARFKS
eukprot:GGOE01036837.1.p1 GENE.GGOE01036837.1~~GGOE01036837.1.p1  ORF type:complete len:497 (+),score=120.83 GGOE01036837.1:44-1534(+)